MKLMIKRKKGCQDLPLPGYHSEHAAAFDLQAAVDEPILLKPGERATIPTGLYMAIPRGHYGRIAPRSGMAAKQGIDVLAGVVDADYRGEVGVVLINLGQEPFEVKRGDRIAQMIITPVAKPDIQEIEELPDSDRGDGGFGSTG